ncbi:5397_t:CDS:10, partial [Entrophospora sp. SA101]
STTIRTVGTVNTSKWNENLTDPCSSSPIIATTTNINDITDTSNLSISTKTYKNGNEPRAIDEYDFKNNTYNVKSSNGNVEIDGRNTSGNSKNHLTNEQVEVKSEDSDSVAIANKRFADHLKMCDLLYHGRRGKKLNKRKQTSDLIVRVGDLESFRKRRNAESEKKKKEELIKSYEKMQTNSVEKINKRPKRQTRRAICQHSIETFPIQGNNLLKELIELNRQKIKQLLEENERILEEQLKSSKRSAFSDHSKSLRVKGSRESSSSSRSNDSMGKKSITLKFQDFQPDGSVKSKFVNPRLFSIPHVKPIPKYAIWTPIIRNIKTKDDPVLRHLYYFGEGAEHDLDIDFYMDVFDKIDFGSSKFDNDECKKQLQSEIDDRVKEFSPLKEINGKDVSKIFKSLQCLRCYRYNCKLHVTKKLHPAPNPNEEPCKNDCYRYLAEKVDYSEQSLESEWNDEEIALFNESCRLIGTEDYCALAAIIKSKSCKEVYQKSQSVDDIITSSEKDPKLINKKASNRAVIIAEYNPCYHPGEDCTSAKCSCLKGNLYCEKYCHCEENCERRFQGCKCNYSKDCVCGTKKCPCFENNRECDFDICKCPAGVQCIYNSDTYCKNVMVQQGRSKSTIIGFSTVAGWGLFMREEVRKSEYIGEYIGEIISHAEADRRGKIYDKRRSSFLFNLNIDTVIDATRKGNKLRFINHSNSPNTNCRVVMANGEHHIAIYAAQLIKPGEELFYDYQYDGHALE